MGADLHWLIERKGQDGRWHAVAERSAAYDVITQATGSLISTHKSPAAAAARQSYEFFSLLADVRTADDDSPDALLMLEELPNDMAQLTRAWCAECKESIGYHSPGWASLGRIKSWSHNWAGIDFEQDPEREVELKELVERRRDAFIALLAEESYFTAVLREPLRDEDGALDFGLSQRSAHDVIEDEVTLQHLLPITHDSVRFFFRFDS